MKIGSNITTKEALMLWSMYSIYFALGCWVGWGRKWEEIIFAGVLMVLCALLIIKFGGKDGTRRKHNL